MEIVQTLRVAGYVRNSSDAQEEANTHAAQVTWLQQQANANGWDLTLYMEPGASGETISGRPEMQRLLADIKAGRFNVVAVRHIDRLCRSQTLTDWATISEACKVAGVRIVASGLSLDLRDATQALMFNMLGPGISGFEKSMILARTKAGKDRALSEGRKPAGRDPYALHYDKSARTWTVNETEAATIRLIYQLAADGASVRQIAKRLKDEAHLSRQAGKPLTTEAVHRYLSCTTYKGTLATSGGTIPVPRIVSDELYEAARNSAAGNAKTKKGRPPVAPHMLSKRIKCGYCASPMHLKANRKWYFCRSCNKKRLASLVDGVVWGALVRGLTSPEFVEQAKRQDQIDDRSANLLVEIDSQKAKVSHASAACTRLALAMVNGAMDGDEWEKANATATATVRDERAKLAALEAALAAQKADTLPAKSLSLLERVIGRLDHATDKDRADVAAACFTTPQDGVYVWEERIQILCVVPAPVDHDLMSAYS